MNGSQGGALASVFQPTFGGYGGFGSPFFGSLAPWRMAGYGSYGSQHPQGVTYQAQPLQAPTPTTLPGNQLQQQWSSPATQPYRPPTGSVQISDLQKQIQDLQQQLQQEQTQLAQYTMGSVGAGG